MERDCYPLTHRLSKRWVVVLYPAVRKSKKNQQPLCTKGSEAISDKILIHVLTGWDVLLVCRYTDFDRTSVPRAGCYLDKVDIIFWRSRAVVR